MPKRISNQQCEGLLIKGKPVILLHASSAAFTHWSWWRRIVGLRWVRVNDPDGKPKSRHLRHPYDIVATNNVPADLALRPLHISGDECYVDLQPEGPVEVLMQTQLPDQSWSPQVFFTRTAAKGLILSFLLSGHAVHYPSPIPDYVANITACVRWVGKAIIIHHRLIATSSKFFKNNILRNQNMSIQPTPVPT